MVEILTSAKPGCFIPKMQRRTPSWHWITSGNAGFDAETPGNSKRVEKSSLATFFPTSTSQLSPLLSPRMRPSNLHFNNFSSFIESSYLASAVSFPARLSRAFSVCSGCVGCMPSADSFDIKNDIARLQHIAK